MSVNDRNDGVGRFTFCDQMPPGSVQRIVETPASDAAAIGLTGIILVLVLRTVFELRV
jgi:hypothetical protein